MKLYTEEQVKIAYNKGKNDGSTGFIRNFEQLNLIPIELPSDEDMEQEAYYKVSDHTENPYASFKSGAKWMKEQIIGKEDKTFKQKSKWTKLYEEVLEKEEEEINHEIIIEELRKAVTQMQKEIRLLKNATRPLK